MKEREIVASAFCLLLHIRSLDRVLRARRVAKLSVGKEICTLMFIDSAKVRERRHLQRYDPRTYLDLDTDSRCSGLTSPAAGAVAGASLFSSDILFVFYCAFGL